MNLGGCHNKKSSSLPGCLRGVCHFSWGCQASHTSSQISQHIHDHHDRTFVLYLSDIWII